MLKLLRYGDFCCKRWPWNYGARVTVLGFESKMWSLLPRFDYSMCSNTWSPAGIYYGRLKIFRRWGLTGQHVPLTYGTYGLLSIFPTITSLLLGPQRCKQTTSRSFCHCQELLHYYDFSYMTNTLIPSLLKCFLEGICLYLWEKETVLQHSKNCQQYLLSPNLVIFIVTFSIDIDVNNTMVSNMKTLFVFILDFLKSLRTG